MVEKPTRGRKAQSAKSTVRKKKTVKRAKKTTGAGQLTVKQVKSGIGHAGTYRRTLRALGLKHYQDVVVVSDNATMRGMLFKVRHLVRVTSEEA